MLCLQGRLLLCLNPRGYDEGFYNSGSEVGSLTRLGCEQGLQWINLRWPFPNLDKLL